MHFNVPGSNQASEHLKVIVLRHVIVLVKFVDERFDHVCILRIEVESLVIGTQRVSFPTH